MRLGTLKIGAVVSLYSKAGRCGCSYVQRCDREEVRRLAAPFSAETTQMLPTLVYFDFALVKVSGYCNAAW